MADLVEDDGDDEAAEEDERLAEVGVHDVASGARSAALGSAADAQACRRHRLEPGLGDALVARLALAVGAVVELRAARPRCRRASRRAGPRAPRPRPARPSPGRNRRSSRRSRATRRRRRRSRGRAGRAARCRRSRSSWSWSRSTAWEVSAIARVYRRVASETVGHPRLSARGPSRSGVGGVVDRPQPFRRHPRVHLRGRQAGVAEQLLHHPDVGPAVEHVGGARVAQHVREEPARQPGAVTGRAARSATRPGG